MARKVTALAPWFGSNRMLAGHVGAALAGCSWVGVPFAGGMSELAHIEARTLLVNDLHRHVINLARIAANPITGPKLVRELRRLPVHPETLAAAQQVCQMVEASGPPEIIPGFISQWAKAYFVCAWMSRNGTAGTRNEFAASMSIRWEAGGGDSATRFRSATESLREWRRILERATFTCLDVFDFLAKCKDRPGHGLYADPPFVGPGVGYKHNCGPTDADQAAWHTRLRDALAGFRACKVVARFYDHELIRSLYPEDRWEWRRLDGGRTQTNAAAPEVLILNRPEPPA